MWARVRTWYGIAPEKLDAALAMVREQVVPMLSQLDGFAGTLLMADLEIHCAIAITLWDSEEALRASDTPGQDVKHVMAEQFGATRAEMHDYPVAVAELVARSI